MSDVARRIAKEHVNLPDISDVSPISPSDDDCLREIAAVLQKHRASNRFGVSLLHGHYPIYEDEVLVEYSDPERRISVLKPVKRGKIEPKNLIQTDWRFDTPETEARRLCYRTCVQIAGKHQTISHVEIETDDG